MNAPVPSPPYPPAPIHSKDSTTRQSSHCMRFHRYRIDDACRRGWNIARKAEDCSQIECNNNNPDEKIRENTAQTVRNGRKAVHLFETKECILFPCFALLSFAVEDAWTP